MLHVDQNRHLYSSRARNIFSKYYFRSEILFLAEYTELPVWRQVLIIASRFRPAVALREKRDDDDDDDCVIRRISRFRLDSRLSAS